MLFRVGRSSTNVGAFLLWASLSTVILIVQITCDLFQESAPEFPLPPLLFTSVLASIAASSLVAASGRRSFPRCFHYYQPFVGGDTFTAMQILGYLSCTSGIMFDAGFCKFQHATGRPDIVVFRGVLSCAGVLMVFGNVMLMASLDHYQKPPAVITIRQQPASGTGLKQKDAPRPPPLSLQLPPSSTTTPFLSSPANRTTLLVLIITLLGNTISPLIAAMLPSIVDLVMVVQLVAHVMCALLIHLHIGCRHSPGYRLFMPLPRSSLKLAFAQGFAWCTFALGLQGSLFVIRAGRVAPVHLVVAVCVTSAVSNLSLLLFVRVWPFHAKRTLLSRSPVEDDNERNGPFGLTVDRSHLTGTTEYFIVQHGRFTASLVTVVASLFVIAVSYVQLYPREVEEQFGVPLSKAALEAIRVCQIVTVAFLLTLPPLTHSIGALAFPGVFDLWAPFSGSKVFIALQGAGWTCYTVAVICAVALLSTGPESAAAFACLLTFGQLLIHASLHAYEPEEYSRPLSPRRGASSPLQSPRGPVGTQQPVLNGELLLSVLMAAGGLTLRCLADVSVTFSRLPLLWFSTIALVLAAPLAHMSIRFRNGPLLSPFQGPPEFVALQAVGWTLYAMSLVLEGIRVAEGKAFGTQHAWSIEVLMYLVPFSMVAFSAFMWKGSGEDGDASPPHSPGSAVAEATYHAKRLVEIFSQDQSLSARFPELERSLGAFMHLQAKGAVTDRQHSATSSRPAPLPPSSLSALRIAGITVATLSLAEVVLFVLAALFSTDSDRNATALVLTTAGMLCATLTCFGVHLIVGPLVHPSTYRIFMPFSGGGSFVVLQACGWGAYSASIFTGLAFLLTRQQSVFALPLAAAGILGSVGQFLVFKSIGVFTAAEADSTRRHPSLLEEHAEGSVAVLLFLATFTLHHIHDNVSSIVNDALGPIVILVSTTSVLMALPLSAVALRKTRTPSTPKAADEMDASMFENNSSLDSTPKKKKKKSHKLVGRPVDPLTLDQVGEEAQKGSFCKGKDDTTMEYFVIPLMTSFPIALLYVAYFALHHYTEYASMLLQGLLYAFYGVMGLVVLLIGLRSSALGESVQHLRMHIMSCMLYMIPTIIVLPSFLVPLVFPTRATVLWALIITLFTIIPPPFNRKILRPVLGAYTGYWCYELVSIGNVFLARLLPPCKERALSADCISPTIGFLTDFLIPVFWFAYSFTFSGAPEEKGRRRSPRFLAFFKKHFYDEACKYFKLRVVAEPSMRGRLNDPKEQFIFGFHPHGVFPATAMYVAETDQWKAELGDNNKTLVTTHGATIIFNGPLLRDFVMAVGGRSVTRRAIERSQAEGNSVVVVLGGQAEMLLTGCSDQEVHLVTHHLGLMRLAIRQNIPLVPIVVLGEHNILDSLHYYAVQKWFLKRIGFPFPLLPMGRWNLPFPKRTTLVVAVGNPVYPPKGASADDTEALTVLSSTYFAEVTRLFDARKAEAGLPHVKLFLHHGLPSADPRGTSPKGRPGDLPNPKKDSSKK